MAAPHPSARQCHGCCVSVSGRGLLVLGASGRGKSQLALRMIALGAVLVADDQLWLWPDGGALWAAPVRTIAGRIEARGLGILELPWQPQVALAGVLDLDTTETERLPPSRVWSEAGIEVPLFLRPPMSEDPAPALLLFLRHHHLERGGLL